MENSGSAFPVFSKGGAETPAEYRFVYNKNEIRRAEAIIYPTLLLMVAAIVFPIFYQKFEYHKLIIVLPALILVIIPLLFRLWLPRFSITFNREGIRSTGFLFNQMPRQCAWNEFSRIRRNELPAQSVLSALSGQRQIVFIHRSGQQYVLGIGTSKRPAYVGVGHSLSIEQVLERLIGPIENLGDAEKQKIRALSAFVDLGREVGHVAYAALGLAVLAGVLMVLPERPRLLDNAFTGPLHLVAGLGAGALACWYMRRIKQKIMMVIPALLLGGVTAMLLLPVMGRLPMLLGTQESLVFKVAEENGEEQRWQAAAHPELTFSIELGPDRRLVHQGVGTEQILTVYRGPGPLNALRDSEVRALYRLVPPSGKASAN